MFTGWRVVQVGSNANNSANTGAFYMNANNTSSNDNVNISGQLALIQTLGIETIPLGKTNNNVSQVLVGLNGSRRLRDT